ncbi:MAG: hypothetical protein S4CHLAM123_15580 [Chlamydiales bacterium]|nr:hypothetical protein [Chlamydiales bacterium]
MRVILVLLLFICGCSDSRSECDKISGRILSQLAKQMRKENLRAVGSGGGCTTDKKINLVSMVFNYEKILDINTARSLIVKSAETLLNLISAHAEYENAFETFLNPIDIMYICIIGETPEGNNSKEIGGLQLIKGKIYYLIDNYKPFPREDGPLLTVHEETFEEAKRILEDQNKAST